MPPPPLLLHRQQRSGPWSALILHAGSCRGAGSKQGEQDRGARVSSTGVDRPPSCNIGCIVAWQCARLQAGGLQEQGCQCELTKVPELLACVVRPGSKLMADQGTPVAMPHRWRLRTGRQGHSTSPAAAAHAAAAAGGGALLVHVGRRRAVRSVCASISPSVCQQLSQPALPQAECTLAIRHSSLHSLGSQPCPPLPTPPAAA